ncbi:MAG TPA: flagellar protein FlgN [Noviherbaspirillum sp.]|nr:flagellar protein FlgN [Noviherbaspirillum sp.]
MQSLGNTLAQTLAEEVRAAGALLDLLRQEQAHLVDANIDELIKVTEEKTKIVARMGELSLGRHRALAGAGLEASEEGMQKWASSPSTDASAAQSWAALLQLAREAKELNRTNGLLIGRHLSRNQAALNILQGGGEGGNMYGPNGQSASQSGSRRLVIG